MGWRYQDLSDAEKEKIGFPLPTEWEYGGTPGDKIWPLFTCPFCEAECESEWGGCDHLMFIYRGSGTDGFYEYLSDEFVTMIQDRILEKFNIHDCDWDEDEFPSIHESFVEVDDKEIYFEELAPEIQTIKFNGSYSFYDFVDFAGFLKR